MKRRTTEDTPLDDLFRIRLENLISSRHPLLLLAQGIDWEVLNPEFGAFYEDAVEGQPRSDGPVKTVLRLGEVCVGAERATWRTVVPMRTRDRLVSTWPPRVLLTAPSVRATGVVGSLVTEAVVEQTP